MIPELSIIRKLLTPSSLDSGVDISLFPKELQGVYRVLSAYRAGRPNESLSVADLANLFFATNPSNRDFYVGLFANLESVDCSDETVEELVRGVRNAQVLRELSLAAYEAAEGRKSLGDILPLTEALKSPVDDSDAFEGVFIEGDLEQLVNKVYKAPGLRWRLNWLNQALGSLRKGDFGFVFSRPETGKTTFLCSEGSFMAEQLPDEAGPIVHFNNEEQGDKVMLRYYQAVSGVQTIDLLRNPRRYQEEFTKKTKGKIKLVDNAHITKTLVERVCAKYNPSLIIFDQIDKIVGFDSDRDDLRLGAIYQWARELAKSYAPVIAVTQADGNGEGVRWLNMGHVANAKTAKQAEADWILGIGKTNDAGFESLRYLNISKNKLTGDPDSKPELRHGQGQVIIQADIARYEDIKHEAS